VIHDNQDKPVRVMIVEDDFRVRAALRSFLSASGGIEVVGDAATPAAALAMARERAVAVALVDVHLPDVPDRLELLRTLTDELGIPAVAISLHSWVRGSALAAGASRFLDTNSAPELLVVALREAVSRHRPRLGSPPGPEPVPRPGQMS
jgi:DNA-binding NarL/FixJ family response regulator